MDLMVPETKHSHEYHWLSMIANNQDSRADARLGLAGSSSSVPHFHDFFVVD
jgi:hypothetical protein